MRKNNCYLKLYCFRTWFNAKYFLSLLDTNAYMRVLFLTIAPLVFIQRLLLTFLGCNLVIYWLFSETTYLIGNLLQYLKSQVWSFWPKLEFWLILIIRILKIVNYLQRVVYCHFVKLCTGNFSLVQFQAPGIVNYNFSIKLY